MANIKITVEGPLMDGHKITFKAPCNCDVVEKLDVRYIEDNTQKSKLFTMKDSHGNDLTGLGNLFYKDAYVDVVLDPNSGSAYLQNAGTNKYLEQKTTPVDNLESDRADLPLSARQGKLLNESLEDLTVYSTEEKVIGTWIDGKPLYRKVLVFDAFNNTEMKDHNIQNVDHIYLGNGSCVYRGDGWNPTNFYNGATDYFFQLVNKTQVYCAYKASGVDIGFTNFVFVLEYTKTTD